MATNTAWGEKLADGRWQRLAARLKEERGWKCQLCMTKNESVQLQVHHGYYAKDTDPWEYEEASLWVVCRRCHEHLECIRNDIKQHAARLSPRYQGVLAELLKSLPAHVLEKALEAADRLYFEAYCSGLQDGPAA